MINVATKKRMLRHSGDQKIELCRDIPYFVATLIQANDGRELSRNFTTMSRHKELKREERMS